MLGSNYDNENQEGLLFVNKRGVTKSGWEAGTTRKYARWPAEAVDELNSHARLLFYSG